MTTQTTVKRRLENPVVVALGAGVVVAVIALVTSLVQLEAGGPGLLSVTVPIPALVLFVVALVAGIRSRSFQLGVRAGALAIVASFIVVVVVAAIEGFVWMARHGVFVLDADPPKGSVTDLDIVLDIFTTGMWIGHIVVWMIAVILGAALGGWIGRRRTG